MVGGAVVAHQSGPVNGQHHMKMEHGHILNQLVEGALQEGGVNGYHRDHPLLGKSSCHGHCMFLRNANIKQPLGVLLHKPQQAGAPGHGGGDGTDFGILFRQIHNGISKGIREGAHLSCQLLAGCCIEFSNAVEFGGVILRKLIAAALAGHHMDKGRLLHIPGCPQNGNQIPQIVAVHGPQIPKAHVLKNGGLQQEMLDSVFGPAGKEIDLLAAGDAVQCPAVPALDAQIAFAGTKLGQMPGHAAHIFSDGHLIVIEDDHHGLLAVGGVIQPLVGHAAGGRAVADEGHHLIILVEHGSGSGHTQGDGDRAGGMSGHKGIGIAFAGLGEAGEAAKLPQGVKGIPAAGEQLVDIGLMPHIKHQPILGRIINRFQRHRQFYHAQVPGQVTPCFRDAGNQKFPNFCA